MLISTIAAVLTGVFVIVKLLKSEASLFTVKNAFPPASGLAVTSMEAPVPNALVMLTDKSKFGPGAAGTTAFTAGFVTAVMVLTFAQGSVVSSFDPPQDERIPIIHTSTNREIIFIQ